MRENGHMVTQANKMNTLVSWKNTLQRFANIKTQMTKDMVQYGWEWTMELSSLLMLQLSSSRSPGPGLPDCNATGIGLDSAAACKIRDAASSCVLPLSMWQQLIL